MKTAIALGTFDGVHTGHRAVLEKTAGYRSVAVTFRFPPKSVKNPQLLMTPQDRHTALLGLGINEVAMFEFEDICNLTPKQFLEFLRIKYNPALIACGFNYRFGKGAMGDRDYLQGYCEAHGIKFACADGVHENGDIVSSTAIRSLIKQGEVAAANRLLYSNFGFTAKVVSGDHRGRTIGFPTINQHYPEMLVVPKHGVYAADVIFDGQAYKGITNIGVRPTYKTEQIGAETYIKDFSGDIYGKTVTVRLRRFIRAEQKFPSIEALRAAIEYDVNSLFDE